jgi:hypothetical protein
MLSPTLKQHSTSTSSLNLRDTVSPPKKVVTSLSHWEVIKLPFCLLGQAWIWIQVLTSLMSGAPLPLLVPVPHCVLLCNWVPHPNLLEGGIPPFRSSCPLAPGGVSSQRSRGCTLVTRYCGSLLAEIRDSEAISRKQHFIMPAQTQRTRVQRLSPENKGVSPYIPLQAGYRGNKIKKQGLTHIWFHAIL